MGDSPFWLEPTRGFYLPSRDNRAGAITLHPIAPKERGSVDLIAAFAAKLAVLERNRIRARVVAGLEKARADGQKLGRPPLVVNRTKVWSLRKDGHSIRAIATTLRLSHGTVQRILEARNLEFSRAS